MTRGRSKQQLARIGSSHKLETLPDCRTAASLRWQFVCARNSVPGMGLWSSPEKLDHSEREKSRNLIGRGRRSFRDEKVSGLPWQFPSSTGLGWKLNHTFSLAGTFTVNVTLVSGFGTGQLSVTVVEPASVPLFGTAAQMLLIVAVVVVAALALRHQAIPRTCFVPDRGV